MLKTVLLLYLLQFVGSAVIKQGYLMVEILVQKVFLWLKSLVCKIIQCLPILLSFVAGLDVVLGFTAINARHLKLDYNY
jgi:hypothetical protein